MSTYMPKAGDITRSWYVLDAEGKTLGSIAAEAAHLLRGKHKPTFAPHADCGDFVIVVNVEKMVLTGNKLEKKRFSTRLLWLRSLSSYLKRQLRECFPLTQSEQNLLQDFTSIRALSILMQHSSRL